VDLHMTAGHHLADLAVEIVVVVDQVVVGNV
jgi:hypothetical protein